MHIFFLRILHIQTLACKGASTSESLNYENYEALWTMKLYLIVKFKDMSFRESLKSSLFFTPSFPHSQGSEKIILTKLHYTSESELFTFSVFSVFIIRKLSILYMYKDLTARCVRLSVGKTRWGCQSVRCLVDCSARRKWGSWWWDWMPLERPPSCTSLNWEKLSPLSLPSVSSLLHLHDTSVAQHLEGLIPKCWQDDRTHY